MHLAINFASSRVFPNYYESVVLFEEVIRIKNPNKVAASSISTAKHSERGFDDGGFYHKEISSERCYCGYRVKV